MDATGEGSLIVYSTQPNNVALDGAGRNSPFTSALVKHVITPGLEVRQMLSRVRGEVLATTERRQTPWDSSSLTGDVYLAGAPQPVVAAPVQSPTPSLAAPSLPAPSATAPNPPPVATASADAPGDRPGNPPRAEAQVAMTAPPPAALKPPTTPQNDCDRQIAFAGPFVTPDQLKRAKHVNWQAAADACAAIVATEPNNMRMQYYYGLALDKTNNVIEALRRVKMAADAGDPDAMVSLGFYFATGHGVLKNGERAFELFSRAAATGNADALSDMGSMYSNGLFVKQDSAKALDYYEKSIEAGNSFALNQIGIMYFNGKGVERNYDAAAEYFQQAADLGDGYAFKFLAILHERGLIGGKPDREKAIALRARAQEADPDSQNPDVPPPAANVHHASGAPHRRVMIVRYRFFGCRWMWC
jgi:hypothetical protein